jgi:hypothetical protein
MPGMVTRAWIADNLTSAYRDDDGGDVFQDGPTELNDHILGLLQRAASHSRCVASRPST